MRKQTHFAATLILFAAFFNANFPDHVNLYIGTYKDIAVQEMKRSGIPASIILAQGIHESAWGKGTLAINSNNHFGIKCKDYWTGPTYFHKDDDYDENGNLIKSCFRAYENSEASYLDHTDFLLDSPRYKNLFSYSHTDYINWAKGLKKCGYATDPKYAEKLIRTIEKYGLEKYDRLMSESRPAIASAPTYTIPQEQMRLQQMFVPAKDLRDGLSTQTFEEEIYDVPAAMPIPEDYQRIDFQSLFKEEPVQQETVQPIPADYVANADEAVPETVTIPVAEDVPASPAIPEEREPATEIATDANSEPEKIYQPQLPQNKGTIIPAKGPGKQRNMQLSRKPRTSYAGLR